MANLYEKQLREEQLREMRLREEQLREEQLREKQLREKQLREKQLREDENRIDTLMCLNKLRIEQQFCDVEVEVEDVKFLCHAVLLAAVSKHFHTSFSSIVPSEPVEVITTSLKGMEFHTFEVILDYIYTGVLHIDLDNAFALLKASDYLIMPKLLARCIEFIEANPSVHNIWKIYHYAFVSMKNMNFAGKVAQAIAANFDNLMKMEEFLEISISAFNLIIEQMSVLSLNPYCALCGHDWQQGHSHRANGHVCNSCGKNCPRVSENSTTFLNHLVKWINHDILERKQYFHQLAVQIQVPNEYLCVWETMLRSLENQLNIKFDS